MSHSVDGPVEAGRCKHWSSAIQGSIRYERYHSITPITPGPARPSTDAMTPRRVGWIERFKVLVNKAHPQAAKTQQVPTLLPSSGPFGGGGAFRGRMDGTRATDHGRRGPKVAAMPWERALVAMRVVVSACQLAGWPPMTHGSPGNPPPPPRNSGQTHRPSILAFASMPVGFHSNSLPRGRNNACQRIRGAYSTAAASPASVMITPVTVTPALTDSPKRC